MSDSTAEDTAMVKELNEKAMDGPWQACHDGTCSCRQIWSMPGDVPVFAGRALVGLGNHKWGDGPDLIYGEIALQCTEGNVKFIAESRMLLPRAVAEIERLQAELASIEVRIR